MRKGKMMIAIVPKGDAALVMDKAREVGAPGGTVMNARGTASSSILAMLGLGDSKKEVLISIIKSSEEEKIKQALLPLKIKGVLIFLKSAEEEIMKDEFELIEIICESGYAEDIMACARKAGAKGGSIINAHGTAREEDTKFFGYPIVAEKEVLLIVESKDKVDAIIEEVEKMDILKQRGKAVIFTMPVSSFKNLGSV